MFTSQGSVSIKCQQDGATGIICSGMFALVKGFVLTLNTGLSGKQAGKLNLGGDGTET